MRTLYTVPTANGQRASIALEECGIDYDTRVVNLYDGEHKSDEMLQLNPFGRMPVLKLATGMVDGEGRDGTVYGSFAIGMYAAESAGLLLPEDIVDSDFYHWIGIVMTDLVPAFAGQFYLGQLAPEPFEWGRDFYADIIERFVRGIDEHLAGSTYFLGETYTLVDVLFYPTAATSLARMPGGLAAYENIARWAELLKRRDAVVRGMAVSS
ncbi:MAG: glutathione S-transferase family protein [Woeseiaceae bacterium]